MDDARCIEQCGGCECSEFISSFRGSFGRLALYLVHVNGINFHLSPLTFTCRASLWYCSCFLYCMMDGVAHKLRVVFGSQTQQFVSIRLKQALVSDGRRVNTQCYLYESAVLRCCVSQRTPAMKVRQKWNELIMISSVAPSIDRPFGTE